MKKSRKRPRIVSHRKWERRKEQDDCFVRGFLEDELCQFSKEGVTMADSVETLGMDLRTKVMRLGAKEKARRKKCKVRLSIIKKNKVFQKNDMKVVVKNVESPCGWDASH